MKPVMYLAPGVSAEDEERRYSPLVTLDNMPLVGGSPGEILVGIPTTNVGSVEVTKAGTRGTVCTFWPDRCLHKKWCVDCRDTE